MSAAVLALMAVPARAAEVGTVPDITWGTSRADVDRTVALLRGAGIRSVRVNLRWDDAEPSAKGVLNDAKLAEWDYAIRSARDAGLRLLVSVADGVPYWASADPTKHTDASGRHWNEKYRPARMADYADFVRQMVARYAPMGAAQWEIWNEPNHSRFWPSGPSAAEYADMLRAAYPAVKAADPDARVVMGGLSFNDYEYLESLYRAGAAPYFDIAAVHPYAGATDPYDCWTDAGTTRKSKWAFCGVEEIRSVMSAHGDSAKQVMLTEFGWSTYSGTWGVSEQQQADYIVRAFRKLESYPWVKAAFVYNFRNLWFSDESPLDQEANFGLVRRDFSPKPAYDALRSYASGSAGSAGGSPGPGPAASPASGHSVPARPSAPRATWTRITRVLARGGRARATSASRRLSALVSGRVLHARGGSLGVALERRTGGRWRSVRTIVTAVRADGRFSVRLRIRPRRGRFRVRAHYGGLPGLRPSTSRPSYFRLTAKP